nr:iron-containing redox enzyme family protein [uncultured Sphingomonas sp.]
MASKLLAYLDKRSLDRDSYARYLSMQYHLTKGVQRYFLSVAAHPSLVQRKVFRKFLFDFANEEEQHYKIAERDLEKLGLVLTEEPFDVELWHSYFSKVTVDRPFLRLGAACILENLSSGAVKEPLSQMLSAPFLNRDNTNFIVLHQHEVLPHGQQILEAIEEAVPTQQEEEDLVSGARKGALFYLRMTDWVLGTGHDQAILFPAPYTAAPLH